ncbi:MAG: DUF2024 family protein [Polaromonas sp.]|nr:DUF2024 family protein [Polaromonas sp.]
MKISVFDTYVQRPDGRQMHFDILVPSDISDKSVILGYGQRYLAARGVPPTSLRAEKCQYCHMESANPNVQQEVESRGFAIIELENCN